MVEFALLRDRMVAEQVEPRGVNDLRVLQAMRQVPRERFVDPDYAGYAYEDRPLPVAEGLFIAQPFIVALMAQAAGVGPTDRVLEIGAGAGYGAAVLSELAARVWSIERHPRLARIAGSRIAELGRANVTVLRAEGAGGWPPAAPFDAIIVAEGAAAVSQPLREQLSLGGRLVALIGASGKPQRLLRVTRTGTADWVEEDLGAVALAPAS